MESYQQVIDRMGDFLADVLRDYAGQLVMVIGHGATSAGLEHLLAGRTIEQGLATAKHWEPPTEFKLT